MFTTDQTAKLRYENAVSIDDASLDGDKRTRSLADKVQRGMCDSQLFFENLEKYSTSDFVVGTRNIHFDIEGGVFFMETENHRWRLHRNAVQQMVSRTGILTKGVANKMMDAALEDDRWGRQLLLDNLHTIFQKSPATRVLVRAVPIAPGLSPELEVRGFLSDKYRRLTCGPIFTAFAEAAMMNFGAVPIWMADDGYRSTYRTDVKTGFSMFLPYVFKPIASMRDEVIIIGMTVENSDFGCGALTVSMQALRIWCQNLMVTQDELRKVHLGSRLSENLQFSEVTHEADTKTMALAVGDIVGNLFNAEYINQYTSRIAVAAEMEVDSNRLFAELRSRGLVTKSEEQGIIATYNEADVELMPAGNNAWRAANAVSLFANRTKDKSRSIEIQHAAGTVLDRLYRV